MTRTYLITPTSTTGNILAATQFCSWREARVFAALSGYRTTIVRIYTARGQARWLLEVPRSRAEQAHSVGMKAAEYCERIDDEEINV